MRHTTARAWTARTLALGGFGRGRKPSPWRGRLTSKERQLSKQRAHIHERLCGTATLLLAVSANAQPPRERVLHSQHAALDMLVKEVYLRVLDLVFQGRRSAGSLRRRVVAARSVGG